MTSQLKFRAKLTRREAIDKIAIHAMYGDHPYTPRPQNYLEVASLLRSLNLDPNTLTEECRDPTRPIPFLENLLGSSWRVDAGAHVSIVDRESDEPLSELDGPGEISFHQYLAHFESARAARDSAVARNSYAEAESAIVRGFSSIEAYIVEITHYWNKQQPNRPLRDSKTAKVSLAMRIDEWIPTMSGGIRVVKTDGRWSDFIALQRVRDSAVHPKRVARAHSLKEIAAVVNRFRFGIAGMLGQLHMIFQRPVPAVVINAVYTPDVEIADA